MTPVPLAEALFEKHNACVLIPTYNNEQTLAAVIAGVLTFTTHVIVVNDGSTDGTAAILHTFPGVRAIQYPRNRGKGMALRTGLAAARDAGYAYAISIDSDGQHFPEELPRFLEKLEETPNSLIVGARNMDTAENVPGKSSFGHRFSNFWYWVNTGIRLPDTQSGYRLYPVAPLAKKRWFTRKYEWEIEVLVRAAWSGVPVRPMPVSVYYPPAGERISHFRPFKDFSRISVLNTVLVTIALLWIKPRDFFRRLFSRGGLRHYWRRLAVVPGETNARKAAAVGFGVFMGIVPVWGFQLLIGMPAAVALRLNKALFLLGAHISVFPITPVWWVASLATGKWMRGDSDWNLLPHRMTLEQVKAAGAAFFLGGCVLATALGLLGFLLTWTGLSAFRGAHKSATAKPTGSA